MVPEMIFVEDLNKILEKLSVAPVDDDPTKIYTRAMIRDIKEKYQITYKVLMVNTIVPQKTVSRFRIC